MNETSILFPNLGIQLSSVGKTIHIFGFEIAYYGIVIALGMLFGITLILHLAKKTGQDEDNYLNLCILTIVCAVIGARIYYVGFSWADYKDNPVEILNLRGGGLAIYGGVLAGVLTVWVFSRVKKQKFGLLADTIVPGLVLGQIIGRWGNFFNREAFGGYTDGLLAMALPREAVRQGEVTEQMLENICVVDGTEFIQVHPTFLYESLWNLAVLLILLCFIKKKEFDGEVFFMYLIGYGLGRVWIEALRTDQLLIPGVGLPVSQVLSAVLAAGALAMIIVLRGSRRKQRKDGSKDEQSGKLKDGN